MMLEGSVVQDLSLIQSRKNLPHLTSMNILLHKREMIQEYSA